MSLRLAIEKAERLVGERLAAEESEAISSITRIVAAAKNQPRFAEFIQGMRAKAAGLSARDRHIVFAILQREESSGN
jgi:hypothetical protein